MKRVTIGFKNGQFITVKGTLTSIVFDEKTGTLAEIKIDGMPINESLAYININEIIYIKRGRK